jgi:hypothetical protein
LLYRRIRGTSRRVGGTPSFGPEADFLIEASPPGSNNGGRAADPHREGLALDSSPRILHGAWEVGPPTPTFRFHPPEGKTVFHEARDLRTGRPVTVTFFRPPWSRDPDVRRAARFGVEQLRRLDSRYVVKVLDVIDEEDVLALVTEPLPGENLRRRIRYRAVTFTEAEVVRLLRELAEGLAHAHERGVVFGNVKPTNVDLTADGEARLVALPKPPFEFSSFLAAAAYLGHAGFVAPEVLLGATAGPAADVYGLGITAYELVGGNPEAGGTGNLATDLDAMVRREWAPPADLVEGIDRRLSDLILRCLERDPCKRFASAGEVARELERLPARHTSLISQTRLIQIVTSTFPAPLASLARGGGREDHLAAQKDRLLAQMHGLVCYLGFLAALSLQRGLDRELLRPSLGHWVGLVREALSRDAVGWPFCEFRPHLAAPRDVLGLLDELVRLRNRVAHGPAPDEEDDLYDWVSQAREAVGRLYKGLLFLARYALLVVEDLDYVGGQFSLRVRRLEGTGGPGPAVTLSLPQPYGKGKVYFASADLTRLLCLDPYVLLARCPRCSQAELFFYVATKGASRSYATPDRGHAWSCPA